ncbi:MAG: STAS domain-containing protein [Acidobacteriia bacterium]|nr:STAS domain-containing protein [Terriglobia bacterium]
MAMNAGWFTIDGERVVQAFEEVLGKLDSAKGEMFLDFSSVDRIDSNALGAMEKLAGTSHDKAVKVVLHGVNVDVYKVLKLAKLAPRFSFLS